MKLEINAPYGSVSTDVDADNAWLVMVQHWIQQLEYFRSRGNNSEELRRDLAGYKELLKADEDTISRFTEYKHQMRQGKLPKRWNDEIVDLLKSESKFVYRQ